MCGYHEYEDIRELLSILAEITHDGTSIQILGTCILGQMSMVVS